MAFDGVFTHYLIEELKTNILEGRINKIYQISSYELIFVIRAKNKTEKLLISINPTYARMHLTEMEYPYPLEPPMFCMFLRKHLEGGIISSIVQKDNDRIILIDIVHLNEIGDRENKQLIIEIMGKHSNIALINKETNFILDSIKHISPLENSLRTLQPGAIYQFPKTQEKVNFFQAQLTDFNKIDYYGDISKQLVNLFEGLSPLLANELEKRTNVKNADYLYRAYTELITEMNTSLKPTIINTENKSYFYLIPLLSIIGENKHYHSLSEMLDRFFYNKDKQERIKQQTQDLEKYLKNELEKNLNKIQNFKSDLMMAENSEIYKLYGELIVANSYLLTKGKTTCEVLNYYDNTKVTIPLDPLLTPIENSQRYFTKYQKAKKAVFHLKEQINKTLLEVEYFENLNEQLKNANVNDALEIRQELEEQGYLKRSTAKQRKQPKPLYETYIVDDITILVGKNNLQNDYITHKLAAKTDMWFHVKDMSGSHVIVRSSGELSERLYRTAAQLAAYYSKGKLSSSVPIDYTRIKNVKKVPQGRLGYVTYDNYKTIYIDPDEDFILSLKKK